MGLAGVGFLVGIYMNYYDYSHDGVLNKPYQAADPLDGTGIDDSPLINPVESRSDHHDAPGHVAGGSRQNSVDNRERQRSHGGSFSASQRSGRHSRGGSFSAYEEINRGGAYRY